MPTKAALLYDSLAMTSTDQSRLADSLFPRFMDSYTDAIQRQLDRLGERKSARRATGEERATLERMATEDAASIVDTYNADLQRKVDGLPLNEMDLEAAKAELLQWSNERAVWKGDQISRATQGRAANYANQQFVRHNHLTDARVIWFAVPPLIPTSHKECVRRVGRGAVSQAEARNWTPTSPNCRHVQQVLVQDVGRLTGEVWRG